MVLQLTEESIDGMRAADQVFRKGGVSILCCNTNHRVSSQERCQRRLIMHAKPALEKGTLALGKEVTSRSILLVDADEPLRLILGMLLENEGYAVTTCADEARAIDLIERNSFDFVISDHSRLGVDGLRLLETVKQRDSHTPVLLMASLYEMGPYIEAMNLGALDYISKPVDYAEIQRLITTHC
jgi:CheY-like chemotaxis protein